MNEKQVITRFAPSPTGALHVGGARTALFAWAYARKHHGQFILRLEDTDQARSTPASTKGILNDLQWLGLDWDQGPDPNADDPYTLESQLGSFGPYFQSQRLDIYHQYIQQLLDSGHAYKCFKTTEQLNAEREKARAEKRDWQYDPTESMALTPDEIAQKEAAGEPCVVRFHMPDDVAFDDAVYGRIEVKAAELEDFVIQKGDGFPTFHLAVVIDDALMNVTHVIRGQEHLYNTTKHVALQDALGFPRPTYAHTPSIMNIDGTKMSKRDKAKVARQAAKEYLKQGADKDKWITYLCEESEAQSQLTDPPSRVVTATDIEQFLAKKNDEIDVAKLIAFDLKIELPEIDVADFKYSGYLPGALLNYISLLGWSPGDNQEQFDVDFIVKNFDLGRINKSNAKFDREKLMAFNGDAIGRLDENDFRNLLDKYIPLYGKQKFEELRSDAQRFALFAKNYQQRCRILKDPLQAGEFFVLRDSAIEYDPKAVKKVMTKNDGEGIKALRDISVILNACDDWTVGGLETLIKQFTESKNIGMGMVAQPLRVAVSGTTVSPPICDTLAILGKQTTLNRIHRCLNELA